MSDLVIENAPTHAAGKQIDQHVGQQLKKRVEMLLLSPTSIGLSDTDYRAYISGTKKIEPDELLRLAVELQVNVAWFFETVIDA